MGAVMVDERTLTVPEVAEQLRVTPATVREWLRTDRLRGYQLGSRRAGWRIRQSAVDAFVAGYEATRDGEAE